MRQNLDVNRIVSSIALLFASMMAPRVMAIEPFRETFDGTGAFSSLDGKYAGLDNPGWTISGNATITDGTFRSIKDPTAISSHIDVDSLERQLNGTGSFVHRLEIRDLDFAVLPGQPLGSSSVFIRHHLDDAGSSFLFLALTYDGSEEDRWNLAWKLGSEIVESVLVLPGDDIALEMQFDQTLSMATFRYDQDVNDNQPPQVFSSVYDDSLGDIQSVVVQVDAFWGATTNAKINSWTFAEPYNNVVIDGDFSKDGLLGIDDIQLLAAKLRSNSYDLMFDLNRDGRLSQTDRDIWVHDVRRVYYGDADLDGEFSTSDLVDVFRSAEYEDEIVGNSTWATGDWNGDADFTSSDMVLAFSDGGYEKGTFATQAVPEPTGQAVPEPTGQSVSFLLGMLTLVRYSAKRVWLM